LWLVLLKRKALAFGRSLRRPTTFIGFLAVVSLLGFLFYFRNHEFVGNLVRRENLIGAALVMLCGSVFKGFLNRGLVFEPPDIEFLFTSPFTQKQIVLYRLLPNYLFAVIQSLVFLALFGSHLNHALLVGFCLILFQIACFHIATGTALFAGSISEELHHRIRWMLLGASFLLAALYLRLEWEFKIIPSFCSSPLVQLLFYPAVTLPDSIQAPPLYRLTLVLQATGTFAGGQVWRSLFICSGFALAAGLSLWLVLRLKGNLFEASLAVTTRTAETRLRLKQGRPAPKSDLGSTSSLRLTRLPVFQGTGSIVWKNLVMLRRSRRQMILASAFVFTYTGFFTALLWIYHHLSLKVGGAPLYEARGFTTGIASFLGMLAFFLQRMFPFDFRRDGLHLVNFRTLPVSPLALTLAEISVPTLLCVAAQACGAVPLIIYGSFDWPTLLLVLLGYPAISLALNAVWNLHYLLAASKSVAGQSSSTSAVGMVMVVALSFLIFFPAGWTTTKIANHLHASEQVLNVLAAGGGLTVQYAVDLLLVLVMARLFQRFEVSRGS
jgi:hypothetical protein